MPVKKTRWAEPPAIEKTRQKRDKEMREEQLRRENKYLGQPAAQGELPGTVCHLYFTTIILNILTLKIGVLHLAKGHRSNRGQQQQQSP